VTGSRAASEKRAIPSALDRSGVGAEALALGEAFADGKRGSVPLVGEDVDSLVGCQSRASQSRVHRRKQ
jgi:hypothetical protein